jgi:DNA-binding NtrC family response regulator
MRADGTQADAVLSLLLVTLDDQHERALRGIFKGASFDTQRVSDCSQALQFLLRRRPSIVILEARREDGSWKDFLSHASGLPDAPQVIVFSRLADHNLWTDVLDLGGYDVLVSPFSAAEVLRTVSLACDARRRRLAERSTGSAAAA